MNDLRTKVEDVISILNVSLAEAESVQSARSALEASQIVATQREQKLNHKEAEIVRRTTELDSQQKYIDERHADTQIVLNKIAKEKEGLKGLAEEKQHIEAERLQLEADRKSFESMQAEREKFKAELAVFEEEKRFLLQEKAALHEAQRLLVIREQNIKQKEDRIDTIERMTQV